MASYWKSQPRKMCEICKCWIGDNKASIDFHERGKSHQEKKKKHLDDIRRKSAEQFKINQKAGDYLKQMEAAAMAQYKKDMKDQGIKVLPSANLMVMKNATSVTKTSFYQNSNKSTKESKKLKLDNTLPETSNHNDNAVYNSTQPYGKWTSVNTAMDNPQSNSIPTEPFIYKESVPSEKPVKFAERTCKSLSSHLKIIII